MKVSPTYSLDSVNSVTLKAFRKIVGYDTFESIRSKNRAEAKATADYYNITVSLWVRRGSVLSTPKINGLYKTLDNGFPYDD